MCWRWRARWRNMAARRFAWRPTCCAATAPVPDAVTVVTRTLPIVNALGLHARAAARFVKLAGEFQAQITVSRAGRTVDGKSILGLLLLAAARGRTIDVSADG